MSLENLHCPQFVDFTATETFDINDGADFFFERGVVGGEKGELGANMDLGMFGSGGDPFNNGVQEITEKLSNMTNMTHKQQMPASNVPPKKTDKTPTYQPQKYQKEVEDKENLRQQNHPQEAKTVITTTPQKPVTRTAETIDDIEQKKPSSNKEVASNMMLDSAISSAIDMILAAKKSQPATSAQTPEKPESLRESLNSKTSSHDEDDNSTPILHIESSKTQNVTPVVAKHTTPEPPKSTDLSKPTAASLSKQKVPVINGGGGTNPNIVKKTLAKMTAAFKPYKPIVVQGSGSTASASSKRMNSGKMKQPSSAADSTRNASANTSTSAANKPLNTSRTRDSSTSNESRLARPMSPETGSNRRCSSVPRTLRERQALNNSRASKSTKNGNTFGEKLQNFFNSNNKTSKQSKTGAQSKTSIAKNCTPKVADMSDRRRSRSVNESINITKTGLTPSGKQKTTVPSSASSRVRRISQNDSMNVTKSGGSNKSSYTKITASPSFSKPRQKSVERTVCVPQGVTSLYTGVKFVPNTNNLINIKKKYNENCLPAFSSAASSTSRPASVLTSALGSLPVEDLLKNRPPCLAKNTGTLNSSLAKKPAPLMRTTPGKSASFRSNPTNTSLSMKAHGKSNMSDLNLSVDKANLNSTGSGFRTRKQSDSSVGGNTSMGVPGLRHTELRALKRQEFDQEKKEKEKHAAILKHELDQEKLRKQAEEIQKIRNQRNFRSNPIKHYKPITLKPSEKSLTEPKSPNLSTSNTKLNDTSRHDNTMSHSSHRLSMALVDAPLGRKKSANTSSHTQNTSASQLGLSGKTRTVSQNDLRF